MRCLFLISFLFLSISHAKAFTKIDNMKEQHEKITQLTKEEIINYKKYLTLTIEELILEENILFQYDKLIKEKVIKK